MNTRLFTLLVSGFLMASCTVSSRHKDGNHRDLPPASTTPTAIIETPIDTGATLAGVDPGLGAGVFIEYAGNGDWYFFTSCDTQVSLAPCEWDIWVTPLSGEIIDFAEDALETTDFLDVYTDQAHLQASTSNGFDGFWLGLDPGAGVEVEVGLDGDPEAHYVYWVGDGVVHAGAPSNPIRFTPSTP